MDATASKSEKFWNPYLAGVALGLVLLATLLVMGKGLGASGAANRFGIAAMDVVAPAHVDANPQLASVKANGASPLDNWLVFEVLGVFLGGGIAAYTAGRLKVGVLKGPRISTLGRFGFALAGGAMMGFAARIARGCTSGQALSGGALLSAGSFIFMFAVFAGGYALALLVRRQWL